MKLSCYLQAIRWCSELMTFGQDEYIVLAHHMNIVAMVMQPCQSLLYLAHLKPWIPLPQ